MATINLYYSWFNSAYLCGFQVGGSRMACPQWSKN